VSGQLHAKAALPPEKAPPGSHWIGDWVDPRAGLEDVEKRKFLTLPGLELRPFGRTARSQSLYRLRLMFMCTVFSAAFCEVSGLITPTSCPYSSTRHVSVSQGPSSNSPHKYARESRPRVPKPVQSHTNNKKHMPHVIS
jgi:hypothetical protein